MNLTEESTVPPVLSATGRKQARRKEVFRRLATIALAVLAQFVLLGFLIWFLRLNAVYLYLLLQAFALVQVLVLLNQKGSNTYTVAWIVVFLVLPIFGELLYLLWGQSGRRSRKGRRLCAIFGRRGVWLKRDPAVMAALAAGHPDSRRIPTYLEGLGFPLHSGTQSRFFPLGELQFEAMLHDLEQAERFIFLEYYIVSEGRLWHRIHEILRNKAAAGLEVRLLYDDVGSMFSAPDQFREILKRDGIQVIAFGEAEKNLSRMYLNHRNHQKITVIDGHIGYTGGTNLADEYANLYPKHGHWKDTAVRLEGDAVWSLTVTFLEMWEGESQQAEDYSKYRPQRVVPGDGFYQPFSDGPVNNPENPAEMVYRQVIAEARDYCYITTPYIVIDEAMMNELCLAAEGGVDVRIATPRIWDHWYVHKVTRSNYRRLIEAGVRVYEYTPGFLHAKMILSDDRHAVIGSINMDFRSFYLHFENGVWICGAPVLADIKADVLATFAICEEYTVEKLDRLPWKERLLQTFLRLFAPLF